MPVDGSYLIPKSMCSLIPNPKLPVSLKLRLRSSYSFTFRPLSYGSTDRVDLSLQISIQKQQTHSERTEELGTTEIRVEYELLEEP